MPYQGVTQMVKNTLAMQDLIPGWGRPAGGEHGNLLHYSRLENPMDRRAWRAVVHWAAKSQV